MLNKIKLLLLCIMPLAVQASMLEDVTRDTEWFSRYESRCPGSKDHKTAQDDLLGAIKAIPGIDVYTQEFPVTVPTVQQAQLTITGETMAGTHQIYPVWPDLARLKTTPENGISGNLIYIGEGSMEKMPARSLRGQIAIMEMSSYANWRNPFAMGANALICIGSPDDRSSPPAKQALYKPRYYIPEGPLADALRQGKVSQAKIDCEAKWQTITARNICATLTPNSAQRKAQLAEQSEATKRQIENRKPEISNSAIDNQKPTLPNSELGNLNSEIPPLPPLAIVVPYDSMSIVMGRAPGADIAIDTAYLLNTLRRYAANPPERPLLFCFVDAYTINQLGMRQLLMLLTSTPDDGTRLDYLKIDKDTLNEYQETAQQMQDLGNGIDALAPMWDKRQYRQLQRCIKDVLGPKIIEFREDNGKIRLAINNLIKQIKDNPDQEESINREIALLQQRLDQQQKELRFNNNLLTEILTKAPISEEFIPDALDTWSKVQKRVTDQLANIETATSAYGKLDPLRRSINKSLGSKDLDGRIVEFILGLDLSDSGNKLGPGLWCEHLWSSQISSARYFTRWLKSIIRPDGALYDSELLQKAVSIPAVQGSESSRAFNISRSGLITSPVDSFRISGLTWRTVDGLRRRVDTPQDLSSRIDWSRLAPQITFTTRMLDLLVTTDGFKPKASSSATSGQKPHWRYPRGTIVTESLSETVPRTPEPDMLITFVNGSKSWSGFNAGKGLRRNEFVISAPDGSFRFPPMARSQDSYDIYVNEGFIQAFKLDDQGRITRAISDSASMLAGRVSSAVNLVSSPSDTPVRSVTFECVELNGPIFFDPRFMKSLNEFTLRDTERGGAPKRYHFSIHDGQMFGLLTPNTRWQLILHAGTASKRMSLMNINPDLMNEDKADITLRESMQTGYTTSDPLPSTPAHLSTIDFNLIDHWRRDKYAKAGIISKPIDELLAETDRLLKEIDIAIEEDNGEELQRKSAAALASEIRAYEALRNTADDITRGAVFLMLLLVPFAVAMERLVFSSTRIGSRICGAGSIFFAMTAILWSFHPAFRITSQPIIILMAFSILLLSLIVIIIIMRKFENDLNELRSGRAEASGAQTDRGGIIGSAVWLGIANMRKRKLRTSLTATTIILITFALLCFSSTSSYQTMRELTLKNATAKHPGILVRLPGMQAISHRASNIIANILPESKISPRYWLTSPNTYDTSWRLHAINPTTGAQVSLKAGLGLSPEEVNITKTDRFMPDWDKFVENEGCYISTKTAELLGVVAGNPITVAGVEFTITGTFDAGEVENNLRMLDGQSLLPYDFSVEKDTNSKQEDLAAKLSSGEALQTEANTACVSGSEVIILPAKFIRQNRGSLRSIGIPSSDNASARVLAEKLMKIIAFPMYLSTDEGVKAMVSTPLIAKPPKNMVVPLLIAALIIFNTMLNSVAERKGEIHIYTSLGLAPKHVGVLFVAEALTYGLIGTISGYVLGQGLATILTHFNLMGGITLNYSGTNVIMTMGLVIFVVVLSAIVPAIMAGKLATPSKDMKWKVPNPENGTINDLLPFTVTIEAAKGLIAFIHEYMDAHREGSIGDFTSDNLEILPAKGKSIVGLSGTVWLAPYDLGVRQNFEIEIQPDVENICGIHMKLSREAGQEKTWWRLNRAFLSNVRRQLLGWRRVPMEKVLEYVESAE